MQKSELFSQFKSPFTSKGVIGAVAGIALGGLQLLGYAVSADDVATAKDLLLGLATSSAGLVALVGRIKASKRISGFG